MGAPVFFVQKRTGRSGKIFKVYKLRTMIEKDKSKLSDKQRITVLGKFMRKFSIDELPQIMNVIIGDMSFVGPRPLLPEYTEKYSERQKLRLKVRPGITGLAQINGRNELKWEEKLELDAIYVEKKSMFLDLKIMLKTIPVVVFSTGFKSSGENKRFDEL